MTVEVTIYTKDHCYPCKATKKRLDNLKVPYEDVDLTQPAMADQVSRWRDQGYSAAPIVRVVDMDSGKEYLWSGYQPETIDHTFREDVEDDRY